jgi:MFS family permease
VVAGGNFTQLGARFLLSPVVPFVIVQFDADKATVGLALTCMWATYALFQFPSGVLADRYGERRLLVTGLAGTVVGTLLIALSPSLLAYGVFAVVLGAGTGLFFSPASSLLSRTFEAKGSALGALTAGGALAGVAYPAVGGYLGATYGWRVAVGLGAVVALPMLLGTVWLLPEVEPVNPARRLTAAVQPRRVLELLSRPSVAYTTVVAILVSFTFQAFSSLFPTFLFEYRGIAPETAGLVFGAVFGLSSLAQPIAGRVSDAISRDVAIAGSVTLTAVGFLTLLFAPGWPGLLAGAAVLGVGISWPGPVQARFMDQLSDEERGYGFGLVRTVYMFTAAPGSVVVGALAEQGGWVLAYGSVIAVLTLCLLALLVNRVFSLEL